MFWVQMCRNHKCRYRERLTHGHMRQFHVDDCNRCRLTSAETNTHCSVRYGGAVRLKHLKTRADSLYSILSLIGSQWSSSLIDVVMESNFRFLTMIRAAALSTDWR